MAYEKMSTHTNKVGFKSLRALIFLAALAMTTFGLTAPETSQATQVRNIDWKSRFLDQAPKGWAEYYLTASRLQGQISTKAVLAGSNPQVIYESHLEIKQSPGCALFTSQGILEDNKPDFRARVYGVNSQYRFDLRRATEQQPWVISKMQHGPTNGLKPVFQDISGASLVRSWTSSPIAPYGSDNDWPMLLSNPAFQIKNVARDANVDGTYVEVEFEMNWAPSKDHIRCIKSGRVIFDAAHNWTMRKCDLSLEVWRSPPLKPRLKKIARTYEYKYDESGFPIILKFDETDVDLESASEVRTQNQFDFRVADLSEEPFLLTAYGFAEPSNLLPSSPFKFSYGIAIPIIGTVCCAILAIIVLIFRRRGGATI